MRKKTPCIFCVWNAGAAAPDFTQFGAQLGAAAAFISSLPTFHDSNLKPWTGEMSQRDFNAGLVKS